MTTVVHGEAESKFCLDHATFMIFDNYRRDPSALQPESQQALRDVEAFWDKVTTANIGVEKRSGFYATLYLPKDGNDCPPTLAVRGTVFPDARGIAIALRVKAAPAFAPTQTRQWAYGFAPGYDAEGFPTTELEEQSRAGWLSELTARGTWIELFSHQNLNTSVRNQLTIIPQSIAPFLPGDYRKINLEARLELWLNRDEGDWAANVIQGVGESTVQYDTELPAAIDDAMREAANYGNQLRIVGHSLGGGLASAGAIYAKARYPDARIWGLGYDSSGVHRNTASRLNTSLERAFEANVVTRAVEDEVLTSMEKRSDFVPIASSAIRFAGASMPAPIGTYVERKGVSPGPIGTTTFAPKWSEMPNLLPLGAQTLISPQNAVATWDNFAQIFASSRNLEDALRRLGEEIQRRADARNMTRAEAEAAEDAAEELSELRDQIEEEAAERAEAAREAAAEQREAEAEARAAAAEGDAEANEPTGVGGFFYNIWDEPRDFVRGAGNLAGEAADEVRDVAVAGADEVRDLAVGAWDEAGDAVRWTQDSLGDATDYVYRHTIQYLYEFARYGADLHGEFSDFARIFAAVAAYHSDELAAFTFAFESP